MEVVFIFIQLKESGFSISWVHPHELSALKGQ